MDDETETAGDPLEARFPELAKLREQHKGRVHAFEADEFGLVVVAKPRNKEVYRTYIRELRNDKLDDAVAIEKFAMACVVYPEDRKRVQSLFDEYPAFAQLVANRGEQLCGLGFRELGK